MKSLACRKIQEHYQPGHQSHGFVWLFLRQPAATNHVAMKRFLSQYELALVGAGVLSVRTSRPPIPARQ